MKNHAGVQRGRQRPPGGAQARRQLVATGDRHVAHVLHPGAQLQLVRRVAHAKSGGDGKGRHPAHVLRDGPARSRLVQCLGGNASGVVAAAQTHNAFIAQQIDQTAAFDLQRVIARQQHTDRRAAPLDHRVGGQRGGQGHQAHLRQPFLGQLVQRPGNALGQVKARGQAFG